jgi:rhomboid family GlyGly-CTERM serine protease
MGLDKLDQSPVNAAVARHWLLPIIAMIVALLLLLGGETAREGFRFDRVGIASGELWRLATGHFVHLGWPHFALNAAGLGLVWYLVGNVFDRRRWLVIAAGSICTMDLGLWYFDPELRWYVGLSGLLHGILAAGLTERLRKPDVETLLLGALLLGKLAWEQLSGPLPGSEGTAGGPVVVDSHLFGALGGALTALVLRIRVRPAPPI